jgi:4'-phosphopantetheinyl transferase
MDLSKSPRIVRLGREDPRPGVALEDGGVEVWLLEPSPERARRLVGTLAPDEVERRERLRTERARVRFTDVRGCLRAILGGHLAVPAADVAIRYGPHGRPELDAAHRGDLEFSVSHSASLAAIAVAAGRPVGLDVEERKPRVRVERLLDAILAPRERERFPRLPRDELHGAFIDLWCVKEACAKLDGRGLSLPLRTIDVDEPTAPVTRATVGAGGPRCSISRLPTGARYGGALALGAPAPRSRGGSTLVGGHATFAQR